jgi:hypothetical protein
VFDFNHSESPFQIKLQLLQQYLKKIHNKSVNAALFLLFASQSLQYQVRLIVKNNLPLLNKIYAFRGAHVFHSKVH